MPCSISEALERGDFSPYCVELLEESNVSDDKRDWWSSPHSVALVGKRYLLIMDVLEWAKVGFFIPLWELHHRKLSFPLGKTLLWAMPAGPLSTDTDHAHRSFLCMLHPHQSSAVSRGSAPPGQIHKAYSPLAPFLLWPHRDSCITAE